MRSIESKDTVSEKESVGVPPIDPPIEGVESVEGEELTPPPVEGIPSYVVEGEDHLLLFGKYKIKRCTATSTSGGGRCSNPALKGDSYCKHHVHTVQGSIDLAESNIPKRMIALPTDFSKELRALRKFLIDLTDIAETPKVLNRVNDLIEVIVRLEDKIKANVTRQQIQQLGFYFASILFKYIPDGQRYEEAKKEFIDAVLRAGTYDQKELDSVIRQSSEVKLYESA